MDTPEKPAPTPSEEPPPPSLAPTSLGPTSLGFGSRAVKSKIERRVFWACIWSLVALGLIVWALVHPKPLPVIVAMTVGQVLGTLSLLLFLGSVALDLRSRYKVTARASRTPTPPPSAAK